MLLCLPLSPWFVPRRQARLGSLESLQGKICRDHPCVALDDRLQDTHLLDGPMDYQQRDFVRVEFVYPGRMLCRSFIGSCQHYNQTTAKNATEKYEQNRGALALPRGSLTCGQCNKMTSSKSLCLFSFYKWLNPIALAYVPPRNAASSRSLLTSATRMQELTVKLSSWICSCHTQPLIKPCRIWHESLPHSDYPSQYPILPMVRAT